MGSGGTDAGNDAGRVAQVEETPSPQRADLSPLPVQLPPLTPAAGANCPALMSNLPSTLSGQRFRPVQPASPFAYAWGDPAVVLVCGVDRPAGFGATANLIVIDGVQWFVDDSAPGTVVWTVVDRPVYVRLGIPSSLDSGPAAALSRIVAATLPFQPPQPG